MSSHRRHIVMVAGLLVSLSVIVALGTTLKAKQEPAAVAASLPMEQASFTGAAFKHFVVDAAPPSGSGCCLDVLSIGDIDGDGKADLMLGSEHAAGVFWYHYPSWQRYPIGPGDYTTDGEVVDVDGDGDGDVVISSISADRIEWWENLGNPFAAEGWAQHVVGGRFSHDLAVGDINGDGKPDVAVFRKENPRQLVWFEAPADPRQGWTSHEVATPPGEGLDVGDIDGDGDLDISASNQWYENTAGTGLQWSAHPISTAWGTDARDIIADMNGDGKNDIVLSHSEGPGRVAWFENPSWAEHAIEPDTLNGAHSLEVGDLDGDGDPDVMVGEMHFSPMRRVMVYENTGNALTWSRTLLAVTGTHNARLGDIGGDGDLDVVGKNFDGSKVVEMWENVTPPPSPALDRWTYQLVDDERERYTPSVSFFGLTMADLNGDRYKDIASGKYVYLNPGADSTVAWKRVTLPLNVDVVLAVDVDGDDRADLIGEALPNVYWLEAQDAEALSWSSSVVGTLPKTSHENGQGYVTAQVVAGGKAEILLAAGGNDNEIYYFEIPDDPSAGNWPRTRLTAEATDEGIGVGDVDGDGDVDVAAGDMHTGGKFVAWFENPGNGTGDWTKHRLGAFDGVWPDRVYLVDLNGDSRLDVLVSEENGGEQPNARVYWYEQPDDPFSTAWPRHTLTTQYTTNGLDVADLDGDGDMDVVTGEHRGTKRLVVWENTQAGAVWMPHQVDQGKESHLGARLADLDGDGDLDLASIAWDDYSFLHVWRNDGTSAKRPLAPARIFFPVALWTSLADATTGN